MFFLKNVFVLFGLGLKKDNFLNINFKKKYKIYLFFQKNKAYFNRFFNILSINNLTVFIYLNFLQFILKKNFNNDKFKLLWSWVSDENLLFSLIYFLNKVYRTKFKNTSIYFSLSNSILKSLKYPSKLNNNLFLSYKNSILTKEVKLSNNYDIKYSGTSLGKYVNDTSLNNLSVYFLRKTRTFNKGRYSRNRQNYRTGVYWCLYINIMVLFALYFYFYGFVFNFGYLWWLLYSLMASFFVPRMIKFRLYDPRTLIRTFSESLPLVFYFFNKRF